MPLETKPVVSSPNVFDEYVPKVGCYDEYRAANGVVRPAWAAIAPHFQRLGDTGLNLRANEAEQMLRENGATFMSSGDNGAQSRPWQLSCLPYVIDGTTWMKVERGLKQRVRVLEAVLADLLGPRQLIQRGILPAELLSANPIYDRNFHQLPLAGNHRLHLTASDLARNDDGSWWVVGHRCRAPSGLGYTLENRVVTSRAFQKIIQHSNVARLASFFSLMHEHLQSLAPRMRDNPRIAILTPGQSSYRYFEDVYLAKYLGYTLVQGRDLAVRGDRLNLKTLGGLVPIEVVWRHISDSQCDPLELDPTATQGVAGMLQSVRSGTVAVANEIGSVLVEMPALLPFLPAVTKALFDEPLILPSIATYWCGSEQERKFVLANLDQLLIRPAFEIRGVTPLDPNQLTTAARTELIEQINTKPHQYVAQPQPARSSTPVWHAGRIQSWYVALRTFQLQTTEDVHVMPGGLVRVSSEPETLNGSPKSGQLGQDCWVIGEQPVDLHTTLLPPAGEPVRLIRSGAELPSRVAEHFFWLGRYVERAESIARLLRTTMISLAGEREVDELPEIPRLVSVLAAVGQIGPDYAIADFAVSLRDLERELPQTVFAGTSSRGLRAATRQIVSNALAVRDRLSADGYRILTQIEQDLSTAVDAQPSNLATAILRMDSLIVDLLAVSGFTSESMTRTHSWRFLQLGRRIERASQTAEVLAGTLVETLDDESPILEAVLRTTDSLITYRSRYLAQLQTAPVIDLLVTDRTNPRSLAYQLQRIVELLRGLPDRTGPGLGRDERLAEALLHQIRMADPVALAVARKNGRRTVLGQLLQQLIDDLPKLSDAITARYLIHTKTQDLTGRAHPVPRSIAKD